MIRLGHRLRYWLAHAASFSNLLPGRSTPACVSKGSVMLASILRLNVLVTRARWSPNQSA